MSEPPKFLLPFIMRRLEEMWACLRSGDNNGAMIIIYDLIPFLDPPIQMKMEPIERKIEEVWKTASRKTGPGSEYGQAEELSHRLQQEARPVIRESNRMLMKELHLAGYFDSEKGNWYDPSKGGPKSDDWRGKKLA